MIVISISVLRGTPRPAVRQRAITTYSKYRVAPDFAVTHKEDNDTPVQSQSERDKTVAGRERQAEVGTVAELLEEIESENLYQVLVTVDGRTLKIVLLKMQGYSTKEIAPLVHLTTGAIYARLDHLRKKLRKIL